MISPKPTSGPGPSGLPSPAEPWQSQGVRGQIRSGLACAARTPRPYCSVRGLLRHGEDCRACGRPSRSGDRNLSGLRARGHIRRHLRVRVHHDRCRLDAPERHLGGLRQAHSGDGHWRPHGSARRTESLDRRRHAEVYFALQIAAGNRYRHNARLSRPPGWWRSGKCLTTILILAAVPLKETPVALLNP